MRVKFTHAIRDTIRVWIHKIHTHNSGTWRGLRRGAGERGGLGRGAGEAPAGGTDHVKNEDDAKNLKFNLPSPFANS